MVVPATLTGSPARSSALRAMLVPVVPCCMAQPITTSSTSAPSILARDSADEIACPNRVAPSVWLSAPLYALPIGVRAVETITASVIVIPLVGYDSRIAASDGHSALLRVPHQMIGRIAKLDVDGVYSLEVMTDVQFVAHAHASVQLHGLLCDEARGVADFRLRARRQFRSIWLPGREAEAQMLCERDRTLRAR